MKEHGPYLPKSATKESKPECPESPDGKHCWHEVKRETKYDDEIPDIGPEKSWTPQTIHYWDEVTYQCCYCGKKKTEEENYGIGGEGPLGKKDKDWVFLHTSY